MADVYDQLEGLLHQLGLHGSLGAVLLVVLAAAFFMAGYTAAEVIVLLVPPLHRRVKAKKKSQGLKRLDSRDAPNAADGD